MEYGICCYLSRATRPQVEQGDYEAVDVEKVIEAQYTAATEVRSQFRSIKLTIVDFHFLFMNLR